MTRTASSPASAPGAEQISLTPSLYACRDAARLLLGSNYAKRMSELGTTLQTTAKAADCHILQAASDAARGIDGIEAMQLLAAAVEIVEPSP